MAPRIAVEELLGGFTQENVVRVEEIVKVDTDVRVVVCNLSNLTVENVAVLKDFLTRTRDIADRYKIFVIQDTRAANKYELVKNLTPAKGCVSVKDPTDLRSRREAFFDKAKSETPAVCSEEFKLLDSGAPWERNICLLPPDYRLGVKGLVDQIVRECFAVVMALVSKA